MNYKKNVILIVMLVYQREIKYFTSSDPHGDVVLSYLIFFLAFSLWHSGPGAAIWCSGPDMLSGAQHCRKKGSQGKGREGKGREGKGREGGVAPLLKSRDPHLTEIPSFNLPCQASPLCFHHDVCEHTFLTMEKRPWQPITRECQWTHKVMFTLW